MSLALEVGARAQGQPPSPQKNSVAKKSQPRKAGWINGQRVPKIAGLNPDEAVRLFGRKNPQHAFRQRGSKVVCPMSQICGMLKNPVIYVEV
jgi:hypothetical protein